MKKNGGPVLPPLPPNDTYVWSTIPSVHTILKLSKTHKAIILVPNNDNHA